MCFMCRFPSPLGEGRIETGDIPGGSWNTSRFPSPLGEGRIETLAVLVLSYRSIDSLHLWVKGGLKPHGSRKHLRNFWIPFTFG